MSAAGPSSVPLMVTGTDTRWASLAWSFESLGFLDSASSTSGRSPTLNSSTLDMPSGETTRMGYNPVGASLFNVRRKGSDELGAIDARLDSADGSLVSVKRENTPGKVDCTRAAWVKFSPRRYRVMVLPRCAPRGESSFSVGTAACSAHPAASSPSARTFGCLVIFLSQAGHGFGLSRIHWHGHESLLHLPGQVVDAHGAVKTGRCHALAVREKLHGINAALISGALGDFVAGVDIVNLHVADRATDRNPLRVGTNRQSQDRPVLLVEFANQGGIVGDAHGARPVHHIEIRNALFAADEHPVFFGMACDGAQCFLKQVDVFDERPGGRIGELGGAVTAYRNQPFAVHPPNGPEHPILMVIHLANFFAGGQIVNADGFVGAAEGNPSPIGRDRRTEQSVAGDDHRFLLLARSYIPNLQFAETRRAAAHRGQGCAIG